MANEFVRNIPEARDVTGSIPTRETTAAAIGAGLGGIAQILDVGLKHSADRREKAVAGTVEDTLATEASKFANQPIGPLVGEPGSVKTPEDFGYSREQWDKMDRLRQGSVQGRVSRSEFYAKTSSIVQQAIHDNPRFADSIRKRAQDVLGIAPTAAAIALEAEGQKAAQDLQTAAKTKLLDIGISQYGIADMFPDGTFNVDGTLPKVQRAIAADAYLKTYNDTLEANLKYKQLRAGPAAKEITLAERKDLEVRMFTGGDQSSGYQGSDTIFHDTIDSFFSTIPAALEKNKLLGVPEQEQMIIAEIGQRKLQFMGWLNSQLNQVTMSPDSKEAIRKNYSDQFDGYLGWATGGFSNLATNANMVKQLETKAGKNGWQASKGWMEARIILGDQVAAGVGSVMLATEAGTPGRQFLDNEALNLMRYLQHGTQVAQGNADTSRIDPKDQRGGMRVVTAQARTAAKLVTNGTSTNPEQDLTTFGNSQLDIVRSAAGSQNVDNLRGALIDTAGSDQIQAAIKLKSSNAQLAGEVGKGMMVTNTKAIALTGQSIIRDVAAANAQLGFQNREGTGGPAQKWSVVFDASEGIYRIQHNIPESQDMRAPLPTIPKAIANKVRDLNNASSANVLLASEFGSDRERGMDGSDLKLAYAKSTGIAVVGEDLGAATTSDNEAGVSAYPTGMVQPGNLDAVGRKGLINEDGSESSALTFSSQDEDGLEVLVPSVIDGVKFSQDAAWRHYKMTGEHFGKFDTPGAADKFAADLHTIMEEDKVQRDKAKEAKKAKTE